VAFSKSKIQNEAKRLFEGLEKFEYTFEDCLVLAETTLKINHLKKKKNAIILAHSYQTPDITHGVADHLGDSYGLSVIAKNSTADIIIFSSVQFMGETAKILNPDKTVLVPSRAGCSLADSITSADVRRLRKKYPNAGFVAYVNTTAEVKAEVDACCTSSNAHMIIEAMPQQEIIFLPDRLMGKNLQKMTSKNLILWDGVCVVHEEFSKKDVDQVRQEFPRAKILAHPECTSEVADASDFVGSTEQMLDQLNTSESEEFMLITECGLTDRARQEHPEKKVVGTCFLCPYMKELQLKNILKALQQPSPDQIIEIPKETLHRAQKSLENMFALQKKFIEKQ
jgi:quinolinate synthase